MRRFVVDHILSVQEKIHIRGQGARHISRVLRMGPGDELVIIDSQGSRYLGGIVSISSSAVEVEILHALEAPKDPPIEIVLCQAALKARAMDLVVQKTTELGVSRIIPFYSERTVVRFDTKKEDNKLRHWREIARNATAQSNRTKPPEILPLCQFQDIVKMGINNASLGIILWEQERSLGLKGLFNKESPPKKIVGLVGPEGGFSKSEVSEAINAGFTPVTVGNRILRAETAAMVLVALCLYEWGDLGSPNPIK